MRSRSILMVVAAVAVLGAVCAAHAAGDKVRTRTEAHKGSETALKQQTKTQIKKKSQQQTKSQDKIQVRIQKRQGSSEE